MSSPPRKILPLEGCSKPPTMRSVVVLPQPDGPSSAKNSPGASSSVRSSTAIMPLNSLVTFSNRTAGGTFCESSVARTALSVVVNDRSFPRYCFEPYRHPHEISCQRNSRHHRALRHVQLNLTTRCCAS